MINSPARPRRKVGPQGSCDSLVRALMSRARLYRDGSLLRSGGYSLRYSWACTLGTVGVLWIVFHPLTCGAVRKLQDGIEERHVLLAFPRPLSPSGVDPLGILHLPRHLRRTNITPCTAPGSASVIPPLSKVGYGRMSEADAVLAVSGPLIGVYAAWAPFIIPKITAPDRKVSELIFLKRSALRDDLGELRNLRIAVYALAIIPTLGVLTFGQETIALLVHRGFSWAGRGVIGLEVLWLVAAVFGWVRIRKRRRQIGDAKAVFDGGDRSKEGVPVPPIPRPKSAAAACPPAGERGSGASSDAPTGEQGSGITSG